MRNGEWLSGLMVLLTALVLGFLAACEGFTVTRLIRFDVEPDPRFVNTVNIKPVPLEVLEAEFPGETKGTIWMGNVSDLIVTEWGNGIPRGSLSLVFADGKAFRADWHLRNSPIMVIGKGCYAIFLNKKGLILRIKPCAEWKGETLGK